MAIAVWPRTGQRIDVLLPSTGERLLAVVDDARPPEQLHLREPVTPDGAPVEVRVPQGEELILQWTSPAGLHELRVTLADFPYSRVALWKLIPLHVPVVEQRREYLRAPDALDALLTRGTHRWHGIVVDMSEGGARCVIEEPAGLALDDTVELRFAIDDHQITATATVLTLELMDGEIVTPRAISRMQFHALGVDADVVRRRVLEQERRARAMTRSMERA